MVHLASALSMLLLMLYLARHFRRSVVRSHGGSGVGESHLHDNDMSNRATMVLQVRASRR